MTRSAFLTGRAIGLAALALVLMAVMVVLGLWQLGVYDDHQHEDAQARLESRPVPLAQVLGPDDAYPSDAVSLPVTMSGRYLADQQFEVRNGETLGVARAVVTPLEVDGGSMVLVVRGRGDLHQPPPSGTVDVTGVLEPSDQTGSSLDADRATGGIRTAALVQDFNQDLYAGYVVLTSSEPGEQLVAITPPTPESSRWAGVRNLVYAVQWWVFAGFVAFMWWRIVAEVPISETDESDAAASSATSVG